MLSRAVCESDDFYDLSFSARALYLQFCLTADDDGFVNSPKGEIRHCGCTIADMEELIECGYLIQFDSGVICIRHWKVNNSIQNDRYTPTVHTNEKEELIEIDKVYFLHDFC